MDSVGLIAAMRQEFIALLRHSDGWKKIFIGGLAGYQLEVSGKQCILVISGMGEVRASAAAKQLIEIAHVNILISFGIAGAVEASLGIGDVVLVEQAYKLEEGAPGASMHLQR